MRFPSSQRGRAVAATIALAIALGASSSWAAESEEDDPAFARRQVAVHRSLAKKERLRFLGTMVDFGAPDFLGVAFVGRPLRWMRLHLAVITNFVAPGVRGGVTFVPINFVVSPSLTVEGGRMFEGNANGITQLFGFQSKTFDRIGYSFVNAHLGIEIGKPNRVLFFIHAGISYVVTQVADLQSLVREQTGDPSLTVTNPDLKYIGPSGKLGLSVYL